MRQAIRRPHLRAGWRGLLALAVLLALPRISPSSAAPSDTALRLAELQRSLGGTTNVQSDFVQEKHLSLLQQTVVIKGRLAVQQPDRLAWRVFEPLRYTLVLDGTTLRQWDETSGKVQQMSLAGNPVFGVVVTQLRAWFAGRFDDLQKDFEAQSDPAAPRPTITFIPRDSSFAAKAIRRVVLVFREDHRYLDSMLIEELSGDHTLMTFTNTVLNAAVDPTVWEVAPHGP